MARLRLAFLGTPDFSVPILKALIDAGHELVCVYSQPPRPAGRGKKPQPSPVQRLAEEKGIEVRTPRSLRDEGAQDAFRALKLDAAVVVAYGLILPQAMLDAPRLGCLNIHASLLPRWRGAAPIHRAIMAGDTETGVDVMQMEAGLDTGPVLMEEVTAIGPTATTGALHDALSIMGAGLIVKALEELDAGRLTPRPQAQDGVTYADKIDKAEARIDWSRPAVELDRLIRGLSPWPGAFFEVEGARIKLQLSELVDNLSGRPGEVLVADNEIVVACGEGAVRLKRLQRPGKAPMIAADFLRGFPLPLGSILG